MTTDSPAPAEKRSDLVLAMEPEEAEMLARHMPPGITYLEFGSGGSTRLAIERDVRFCLSVESDPAWIEKMRMDETIREAEKSGRLVLQAVDIGPVMAWGMPADRSRIELWQNYFLSVWGLIDRDPDLVLIDGRFRTACGLAALLACPSSTSILMHDFFDALSIRKNYRSLLDVAEIVERQTNLVSLRRKPEVTARVLLSRLSAVWSDFA